MKRAVLIACMLGTRAFADDATDLARAARSPADLATFIQTHLAFDWEPLWKELHAERRAYLGPCERIPDHGCSTERIDVAEPRQTILVIFDGRDAAVYLQYRGSAEAGWKFTGLYSPELLNAAPEHYLTAIGTKPYL